METGAEEPEQSESSAEIAKSADVEDSTTTKSLEAEEVHNILENALTEKSLHTNEEGSSPHEDDSVEKVSGTDPSVSTPDSEGGSGSTGEVLEDYSAAGIENTAKSQLSPDGVKEVKEPDNETKNSSEVQSEPSISTESELPKDSAIVDKKETEPAAVLPAPEETVAAESTESDPLSAVEKLPEEEKTSDETTTDPKSEGAIATEPDSNVDLPTSRESSNTEEIGVSREEFSEEMAPKDVASTEESSETTSVVEDKNVELPATNDELTKEGNGADATPSIEEGIDTGPATTDEERTKDQEDVGQEFPPLSDSATTLAVEEDKQGDSLTVHAEPTEADTVTEELPVPPAATVEGTGIEDRDVEHATVENESPKENVAHEEAPELLIAVEGEGPSRTEADEAVLKTGAEPVPTGAESVDATVVEDGKKDVLPRAPHEGTVPSGLASAPESTGATLVENAKVGNYDEDFSLAAASHDDTKPDELGAAPDSTETTPVENAKSVEPGALPKVENVPVEATSTVHTAETTPAIEEKDVETPTTQEGVAEEPLATEEFAGATPVEDAKDAQPETLFPTEFTEANPAVEDKGVEPPTPDEELATEEPAGDDLARVSESPEIISTRSAVDIEPLTTDELTEDSGAGGETIDSAEVIPAVESKDGEASVPYEEATQERTVADESSHYPESLEDADDVETKTDEEVKQDDSLAKETILPTEPVEATPAVEERDVETTTAPIVEPNKEDATDGATPIPESGGPIPDEHDEVTGSAPADKLDEEEEQGGEVPPAGAFPTVDDNDAAAPALPEEHADVAVKAESGPAGDGEINPIDKAPVSEPFIAEDGIDKVEVLGDEVPSTEDLAGATSAVEDKGVEAPTPPEELAKEDEVVQSQEVAAEETPLTTASEDAVPAAEEKDVDVQPEEVKEETDVKEEKYAEPVTGDEVPNEEEYVADDTPSTADAPKASPAVEGEALESPKDVEATTSHEELTKEVPLSDEVCPGSESSETYSTEDEGYVIVNKDVDISSSDQDNMLEPPTPPEEHLSSDDIVHIDADNTPDIEEKNVEASTSQEELAKGDIADEAAQSPESVTATLVQDTEEEELTIGNEDANKEENVADEVLSTTHSADANIPAAAEGKDLEVPTTPEELVKEKTGGEVAQDSESAPDEIPSAKASEDAIPATEDRDVDVTTPHQESANEEATTDEVPHWQESMADDIPLAKASEDPNPAAEDKDFEGPTTQDELAKDDTTPDDSSLVSDSSQATSYLEDELAPIPESVEPIDGHDAQGLELVTLDEDLNEEMSEEETTDEAAAIPEAVEPIDVEDAKEETTTEVVSQSREFAADEVPSTKASEDVTPAAEDKDADMPTPHAEPAKEETTTEVESQSRELAADEPSTTGFEDAIPVADDKEVDVPIVCEDPAKKETTEEVAQSEESGEGPLLVSTKEEPAKEEITTEVVSQSRELAADEVPSTTGVEDANRAADDKEVDVPIASEDPANKETTVEVARSQESGEGPLVESTKEPGDLNKEPSLAEEVSSITNSDEKIPTDEEQNVESSTSHDELVKDEIAGDVSQSPESVEATPLLDSKDGESTTGDEETVEELNVAHEIPSTADDSGAIPAVQGKDMETPTSQEELGKDETVTEDLASIPVDDAKTAEPVAADEEIETHSTAEEQALTTDSIEVPHAVEGKGVEVPKPIVEEAKEDAASESALAPESGGDSPTVKSGDVEPAVGEEEVPEPQEQLAQEHTLTREFPTTQESPVVTSIEDENDVEPETGKDEVNEEKNLADGLSIKTGSIEPVGDVEAEDAQLPTPHNESDGVTTDTEALTSTSEVAEATTPIIEDKAVESSTQVQLAKDLPVAEEVPGDAEPAPAPVVEDIKHVEPATKELIHSEAAPATEESAANATDLAAEPAEIVDKHVLTADSPEDEALTTVATENPETERPGANGNKLEEQVAETVKSGEGLSPDGDSYKKAFESFDPATKGELPSAGESLDTQEGLEAHFERDLRSALLTTSSSKEIRARDFDLGLPQELEQEKVQNVAQHDPEKEIKASVPLSKHSADLSSSWISVSPIQRAEVQSASAGSQLNLSQRPQSGGPEEDLPLSGGEDWRIVSEQDVALDPSRAKDLDSGSSGAKFPFSIVLWCSQSLATLFGGSHN